MYENAASSNASVMDLSRYPTLARFAKSPDRLRQGMAVLANGQEAGQIRNVAYQDAKTVVSRAVEEAWGQVRGAHFHRGRWEKLPQAVQELDYTITLYGLHHVPATHKRLTRSKLDHIAVRDMRAFVAEVLPLAEAVAALKAAIVKGRAPSTGPSKPVNPDKIIKTCPCCFRAIAVVDGTMAHHGYQRPGQGWQTASCPGIRFKPLEVSSEGLAWLIANLREQLASTQGAWRRRASLDMILVRRRGSSGVEKVTPDMPTWVDEFRIWCANTESEIHSLQSQIERYTPILEAWKPETAR